MSANAERAWAALSHGRWEVAEREWRLVLAESPDHATAHAALALALNEREQFVEANREADLAVGLEPDSDFAHSIRARVLRDRNLFTPARAAAEEAVRLDPADANNRAVLASIHIAQEHWADALRDADAGLACDPEHDDCTNMRALALTQLGRKDEAAATINEALQRAPENSVTHANQGWALLHRGEHRKALDHFREALRLDPGNDWARQGLLTALKARNPLFRVMLAYFLFMSRQGAVARWAIILGVLFGQRLLRTVSTQHPEWHVVLVPLLVLVAVFIYSTWLANPLMNLVMRFDRFGRHALTADQSAQAVLIGCCIAAAAAQFSFELACGFGHLSSLLLLLLSIPLTSIHDLARGWPRRLAVIVSGTFALIAVFEVAAINALHLAQQHHPIGKTEAWLFLTANALLPLLIFGILAWSVLGMAWLQRVQPTR